MQQMYITDHGGPDKLQLREAADPQPQGDQERDRRHDAVMGQDNRRA